MMNTHSAPSGDRAAMTDAAVQALDELLSEQRKKVLDVARSASEHEVLTAADVVRAYYSLNEPRQSFVTRSLVPRKNRLANVSSIVAVLAGLLSAIVSAGFYYFRQEGSGSWSVPSGTLLAVLVSSAVAIALTLAMYTLRRMVRVRPTDTAVLSVDAGQAEGTVDVIVSGSASADKAYQLGDGFAFLNEWSKVENKLRHLGDNAVLAKGSTVPRGRLPIGAMIAGLVRDEVIDGQFASDLRRVISVRNKIAHGEQVTASELEEVTKLLALVDARLDGLLPRLYFRGGPRPRPS